MTTQPITLMKLCQIADAINVNRPTGRRLQAGTMNGQLYLATWNWVFAKWFRVNVTEEEVWEYVIEYLQ